MLSPLILKPGSNPACVHWETVVGMVGTCQKCGQVREYPFQDIGWTNNNGLAAMRKNNGPYVWRTGKD